MTTQYTKQDIEAAMNFVDDTKSIQTLLDYTINILNDDFWTTDMKEDTINISSKYGKIVQGIIETANSEYSEVEYAKKTKQILEEKLGELETAVENYLQSKQ
ncbi:hypothetical protein CL617_02055 [archaeon]|nr:hypothetical protein [archaeon]|tara:strand:+ start:5584 stop:5889 length:306 start_codon:yes stop_codon:yes gene_type:complete